MPSPNLRSPKKYPLLLGAGARSRRRAARHNAAKNSAPPKKADHICGWEGHFQRRSPLPGDCPNCEGMPPPPSQENVPKRAENSAPTALKHCLLATEASRPRRGEKKTHYNGSPRCPSHRDLNATRTYAPHWPRLKSPPFFRGAPQPIGGSEGGNRGAMLPQSSPSRDAVTSWRARVSRKVHDKKNRTI